MKEICVIKLGDSVSGDGEEAPVDRNLASDNAEMDETDFPVNFFQNEAEIRAYMSENCMRVDHTGAHSRYALKELKDNQSKKHARQGLFDLALEAKFLSSLNHPSIIKLRGLAGEPLCPNFGLVLDRLYSTLEDQMDDWISMKKKGMSSGLCGCLGLGSIDESTKKGMRMSVVTIAYDITCALRYIHEFE